LPSRCPACGTRTGPPTLAIAAACWLAASGHWPILLRAVLGGLALAGFYLALLLISPSAMGLGDVKLAAAAGFLLGGLVGIALLVSGRATKKQHIPFGPVLIAGAFLVILL
jgi:leader peptidase (prepilin peptidase)/N-methyltransferase